MSDDTGGGLRQPGWYPDATDPSQERWWDGRGWTTYTRTAPSAGAPAVSPASDVGGVVAAAPVPARRGVPVWATVLVAVLALVVGGLGGGVIGLVVGSVAGAASRTAESRASDTAPAPEATRSDAEPSPQPSSDFEYSADAFTITLKVLSKECFGSAGCNVTVKPVLSTDDPSSIPDAASGTLTYEITGGDDGEVIETATLTGSQYRSDSTLVSTRSSSTKLHVRITDVETD